MAREKNFTKLVREKLCNDVGGRCSKPDCRVPTKGGDDGSIGKAAHITAASKGGPRYDPNLLDKERHSEANGIWLCGVHHDVVDKFPEQYPVDVLKMWKKLAIETAYEEMTTGRLKSSALANLKLQLICKTADHFRDDNFILEVLLVNTGNKSVKLDPSCKIEIIIPKEEPISRNLPTNQLVQPAESLPIYYLRYPIQHYPSNAEIIIKFHYPNETSLEVKRSIQELFDEAVRLEGERIKESYPYQPFSKWREPTVVWRAPTPW